MNELSVEISDALAARGFSETSPNKFSGTVQAGQGGTFTMRVELPPDFPAALPNIYFEPSELPKRIAHIQSGKACIAHSTGLLLDRENPVGIIVESIERARKVLEDGLSGTSDPDFLSELQAYWNEKTAVSALSTVNPSGPARKIVIAGIAENAEVPNRGSLIFAEDVPLAETWLAQYGAKTSRCVPAFYLPLRNSIPYDFATKEFSSEALVDELTLHSEPSNAQTLRRWLKAVLLPAFILLSIPTEEGSAVVAIEIQSPEKQSQGGLFTFRPGQKRAINEISKSPRTNRLKVDRFDTDFVLPRGGAESGLLAKTAAIVGCGAIGSQIAFALAKCGIGALKLIDPDLFVNENIHRHVLGSSAVGQFKTQALARMLSRQLPHLRFEFYPERIAQFLRRPSALEGVDLVVNATGDETIGLVLNEELWDKVPVVHVWNDPLGLGGHALLTIPNRTGCYACLFSRMEDTGTLFNAASFVAPNQVVTKSFAGCAGVFVPFSFLDAAKTALEGSTLIIGSFRELEPTTCLRSWFGNSEAFVKAGFQTSRRAALFAPDQVKNERSFTNPCCPICKV